MRRIVLAAILALASLPALAQVPVADKPVTLTVTQQELTIVANALAARPYSEVAALMAKLQGQVTGQLTPPAPVEPVKP